MQSFNWIARRSEVDRLCLAQGFALILVVFKRLSREFSLLNVNMFRSLIL